MTSRFEKKFSIDRAGHIVPATYLEGPNGEYIQEPVKFPADVYELYKLMELVYNIGSKDGYEKFRDDLHRLID